MATVKIITVGTLKEDYLRDAVAEYEKRISGFCKVESVNIKEAKLPQDPSEGDIRRALAEEAKQILANMPDRAYKIAMCVEGKQFSSEELASTIDKASMEHSDVCCIIGSSHGLSPRVKQAADFRLSFSSFTFPHQLMRLVLMESVYRSFTIIAGKKYHK